MQTERQKEIIETALQLISQKGIQGLTIKNLSKEIGITEPAIYRHFENKITILTTILDTFKNRSNSLFSQEIETTNTTVEKIEQLFNNHFKAFVEMPSLTSVVFSEEIFRNESSLTEKITDIIEYNNKILTEIIREGQLKKEIRNDIDPQNLTIMVMGTLRLFIKKWQLSGFDFDLIKQGKEIIEMIKLLITKQ